MKSYDFLVVSRSNAIINDCKDIITKRGNLIVECTLDGVKNVLCSHDICCILIDINDDYNEFRDILEYISISENYYNESIAITNQDSELLRFLENYDIYDFVIKPYNFNILKKKIESVFYNVETHSQIEERLNEMNDSHLKAISKYNPFVLATFKVNVTKNECIDCTTSFVNMPKGLTANELLEILARYIKGETGKKRYLEDYSMDNLHHQYLKNNRLFIRTDVFEFIPGTTNVVTTKVELFKNPTTNDIEAIATAYDVNNANEKDFVQTLVLKHTYDSIAKIRLIDNKMKVFTQVVSNKDFENQIPYEYTDYIEQRVKIAEFFIEPEDRTSYYKKSAIETVVSELSVKQEYSFTVRMLDPVCGHKTKQFNYFYADKNKTDIVTTMCDIASLVEFDELSNCYNSKGFINQLTNFLVNVDEDDKYVLLFFDLMGFKAINSMMGTEFGDYILERFSPELEAFGISPIILGRLEADHFAALIKDEDVDYSRLENFLHGTVTYESKTLSLSSRCGIYRIKKGDSDPNEIIANAKIASEYKDKDLATSFFFFNSKMKEEYLDNALTQLELERALDNKEFLVYYQPVYDLKTNTISSAEALIRWKHPEIGMISPAKFIPSLEKSGQISKVDAYVLRETIKMNCRRRDEGKKVIPISTNLSRIDLFDSDMLQGLFTDLNTTKSNSFIRLEITESVYTAIASQGIEILDKLKSQGTKFYIDDFGTGYSSFASISQYDFDYLKLDITFTRQIGKSKKVEKIIEAIINMSHSLGLQVVAEGVETEEQLEFFRVNNCDLIQGYYYSKPLSMEEFELLVDKNS